MINLVIAIKSGNLEDQYTALNFIEAVCCNSKTKISMIFFYQHAVNILLNSENNNKLVNLLNNNKLTANLCKSACTKRGLKITSPFVASTIIEFLNYCNNSNRVIQF